MENTEENIIRDEVTFAPVENSGEGDDMKVSITRNIEKSVVDTITIGEAKNKLDFVNRQIVTLDEKKSEYISTFEAERTALLKEVEKYENIISSVN